MQEENVCNSKGEEVKGRRRLPSTGTDARRYKEQGESKKANDRGREMPRGARLLCPGGGVYEREDSK